MNITFDLVVVVPLPLGQADLFTWWLLRTTGFGHKTGNSKNSSVVHRSKTFIVFFIVSHILFGNVHHIIEKNQYIFRLC